MGPDGEVTLASSPFHVRFGKLQVLRAGEKRVTIRLPNNLPPPHIAPFSMKVGETGEAFFVLETTDDVPEDLMTSPVVMPTEVCPELYCDADLQNDLSDAPTDPHDVATAPTEIHSLTQQPFGETERLAGTDDLDDVPNLDLNEPQGKTRAVIEANSDDGTTNTSVFSSAASLLPSIPFMSSRAPATADNTTELTESSEARHRRHKSHSPDILDSIHNTESSRSEDISRIVRDHSSSDLPDGQDALSKNGEADLTRPHVLHRNDVVLDIAGYHSEACSGSRSLGRSTSEVRTSVLDTFSRDLLAAIPNERRPVMTLRSTDPNLRIPGVDQEPEQAIDESDDEEELEARRFDRAKSEPPVEAQNPVSPTLDPTKAAMVMDYAWDWGRVPPEGHREQGLPVPERRESLPPLESDTTTAPSARLRNVEENPYLFVFDSEGRSHTFELSLSEDSAGKTESITDFAKQSAFLDHRITFQKFIESPQIVDDPRLVVRYSLQ